MKKYLFFFVFVVNTGFAQKKVFFEPDYSKTFGSYESLQKKYNGLEGFDAATNNKILESERFSLVFSRLAKNKNIRFSDFNFPYRLEVSLFSDGDGKVALCIYQFSQTEFSANRIIHKKIENVDEALKKTLEALLNEVVDKYEIRQLSMRPFYIATSFTFGKNARQTASKKTISSIEQAQQTNRPDTVKIVNFSSLQLKTIPNEVFRFKNLEELILKNNEIKDVSMGIFKLKKLKMIDLSINDISDSSIFFARNKHLKTLNLQANNISTLPFKISRNRRLTDLLLGNNSLENLHKAKFKRLKKLKNLNLYNAGLNELPKEIARLSSLEELDLYHNGLRFLPNEIIKLSKLKTLAVSNNQLWKLPNSLAQLKNLQKLYVHHNKLSDLPQLPDLQLLDIGYNLFKEFPKPVSELKNIEELDFTKNQIDQIPTQLLAMPNLKKVYLFGNEYNRKKESETEFIKLYEDLEKKGVLVR